MLGVSWIDNGIQSIVIHFDWRIKDAIKALIERRYNRKELRKGNILFELCVPTERVCSFDMKNFFTFYGMIMEKICMMALFTPFQ